MKYQIHTFKAADPVASTGKVGDFEGVFTEDALNAEYFKTLGDFEPSEGEALTIIDESHAWFVTSDPQGAPGTNENLRPIEKAEPIGGDEVPTDVLLVKETQRSLDERKRNIEHEAKVREALKELEAAK